jgi:hypothetical protein
MEIPNRINKFHHMKWAAIPQDKPVTYIYCRMNHICTYRDERVLTIV